MRFQTSRRAFLGGASMALAAPSLLRTSILRGDEKARGSSNRDFEALVGLILETPRERCAQVLGEELRRGLSYRQALAGLLHAAVLHQGTHEIAMMFSAQRISGELPVKDALLPLFWAFDSLARRIASVRPKEPVIRPLATGTLPSPDKALRVLNEAVAAQDRPTAELAAVSLFRSIGARQTLELVWRYACRDGDNLGHKAIVCANIWRSLDSVGWEHAEIPLRYVLGGSAPIGRGTDGTYESSRQLASQTQRKLPSDWSSAKADHKATLELYEEIRAARTASVVDWICQQLTGGTVTAGSAWDAIHLSAADLLYRFKTREDMRGWPVHSVTSSNALHYAFRNTMDNETRLLLLLQAAARISDQMTRRALDKGQLRDIRIADLGPAEVSAERETAIQEIFALLPCKRLNDAAGDAVDRPNDDEACRKAFALLTVPSHRSAFIRSACELVNRKATWNAHDFKFPAAAFEDTGFISECWRPHFLAATVHAIHGPRSEDAPIFEQAREMLATL
jgi:hypothetical protein